MSPVPEPISPDPAFDRQHAIERFEAIHPPEWESILATLDSDASPALADWRDLGPERPLGQVLKQLAAIHVSVPGNNVETMKETHDRTIENHIKLALTTAGSRENLADFLELVQARLASQPGEAQGRLAWQALWVWAPAAEVVGLHQRKTELEEAAFPILYPEASRQIGHAYEELRHQESAVEWLQEVRDEIEEILANDLQSTGACTVAVKARRKTDYSVWRKSRRKGLADFQLPDFVGFRAVISVAGDREPIEQCYAAASILTDLYTPDPNRTKDYINRPKANGYRSIHLTVRRDESPTPIEIQIRTAEMDRQAEESPEMSHLSYEAAGKFTPGTYEFSNTKKPAGLYRWRDEVAEQIRRGQTEGWHELNPGCILAFTPDGNLHEIPEGSTVLDASFAIHSRRARRTKQIKINGKQMALDAPVRFGDCVDITYAEADRWTLDWIKHVRTEHSREALHTAWKQANAERLQAAAVKRIEAYCAREWGLTNPLEALTDADKERLRRRYSAGTFELALRDIGARQTTVTLSHRKGRRVSEKGIGRIVTRIQKNLDLPAPRHPFD